MMDRVQCKDERFKITPSRGHAAVMRSSQIALSETAWWTLPRHRRVTEKLASPILIICFATMHTGRPLGTPVK